MVAHIKKPAPTTTDKTMNRAELVKDKSTPPTSIGTMR